MSAHKTSYGFYSYCIWKCRTKPKHNFLYVFVVLRHNIANSVCVSLQGMSPISVLILVFYILGSLTIFGMILDASPKAPALETARCVIMIFVARCIAPSWGVVISPPMQLFYILSALFWSLFVYKTVELRAIKSFD